MQPFPKLFHLVPYLPNQIFKFSWERFFTFHYIELVLAITFCILKIIWIEICHTGKNKKWIFWGRDAKKCGNKKYHPFLGKIKIVNLKGIVLSIIDNILLCLNAYFVLSRNVFQRNMYKPLTFSFRANVIKAFYFDCLDCFNLSTSYLFERTLTSKKPS